MNNACRLQLAFRSGVCLLLFGLLVAPGANPDGTSAAIVFGIGALLLLGRRNLSGRGGARHGHNRQGTPAALKDVIYGAD